MLGKHFNSNLFNKSFAKNYIPPRYGRIAAFGHLPNFEAHLLFTLRVCNSS